MGDAILAELGRLDDTHLREQGLLVAPDRLDGGRHRRSRSIGVWELWSAAYAPPSRPAIGQLFGIGDDRYLFGVVFVGGGVYGFWQTDQRCRRHRRRPSTSTRRPASRSSRCGGRSGPRQREPTCRPHPQLALPRQARPAQRADASSSTPTTADYPAPASVRSAAGADVEGLRKIAPEAVAEYRAGDRAGGRCRSRPPMPSTKSNTSLTLRTTMIAATTRGDRRQPARRGEHAELPPVGGEQHQRDDREGQLQAEDDLAEDQELRRAGCRRTRS